MTQEAIDQVIGRLVRERTEANKRLAMLQRAAKQRSDDLRDLSMYLSGNASRVWIRRPGAAVPKSDSLKIYELAAVDGVALADLLDELRSAEADANRLDAECRQLGV